MPVLFCVAAAAIAAVSALTQCGPAGVVLVQSLGFLQVDSVVPVQFAATRFATPSDMRMTTFRFGDAVKRLAAWLTAHSIQVYKSAVFW